MNSGGELDYRTEQANYGTIKGQKWENVLIPNWGKSMTDVWILLLLHYVLAHNQEEIILTLTRQSYACLFKKVTCLLQFFSSYMCISL